MFELAIDREKRKDTAKARCLKMKTPVPCAAECAQSKTQTKPLRVKNKYSLKCMEVYS